MSDEVWVPADGAGGVIHLTYDADDVCRVHREAMQWLLDRAGFERDDRP